MASIVLLAHPPKFTHQQFNDSLKSLIESRTNLTSLPSVLPQIDATQIKQCVFGPNHIAFLMNDGRVCRVGFHLNPDSATCSSNVKDTSSDDELSAPTCKKKTPAPTSGSTMPGEASSSSGSFQTFTLSGEALSSLSGQLGRWSNHSVGTYTPNVTLGSTSSSSASALASRVVTARGRGRIIRTARGRSGGGWLNNRAVIPASSVPEELISQAQIVLQGKSRQVIIRELQKTSLDVNLAVNNLLSRDDNDPDEDGEDYIQEAYLPSEDLISIFEAGIPNDEPFVVQRDDIFAENSFYQIGGGNRNEYRNTSNAGGLGESSSGSRDNPRDNDDDIASQMQAHDAWWSGSAQNAIKEKLSRGTKTPNKSKVTTTTTTTLTQADTEHVFGEVVWWRIKEEEKDNIRFAHIASLHSELLAVTEGGYLHRWKWSDKQSPITENNGHFYPRAFDLQLTNEEKITKIAACNVRVSILTESGKLATWLDDSLAAVGHRLEHNLQLFTEFRTHTVQQLHVCDHYTCVQLSNGSMHWWGVFPFEQRKKILDKVKAKAKKSAISGSGLIKPDTQVCIRSCPLYYPGAIGFTTINGQPRVGELKEQAWTISEKCRFKILPQSALEKKNNENLTKETRNEETFPESQTTSELISENSTVEQSKEIVQSQNKTKKRKLDECSQDGYPEMREQIEEWCLRDVIFVEEVRSVPIGRVLKVDGAYALVHFSPHCNNEQMVQKTSVKSLLSESRLLRKDELQIVKWTTPPKMPECFQRTPKQFNIPRNSKVLAFTLDKKGVHSILKSSSSLRYTIFSLASGRSAPGGHIHAEPSNFLSKTNSLTLHTAGDDSLVLLKDPNECLYPLVKDKLGGIQKPSITNMLQINSIALSEHFDGNDIHSQMNLTLFVMKENSIIRSILKKDSVVLLHELKEIEGKEDVIEDLVRTKCDGNRNLFHICVSTCQPQSTKQSKLLNSISTLGLPALVPIDKAGDLMEGGSFDSNTLWEPLYNGLTCLEILINNPVVSTYTRILLSEQDAFGCTPFMAAIQIRAYPAAAKIYDAAVSVSKEEGVINKDIFMSMICPAGTDSDISPLQVLCFNDTCSFTWTGTRHINQDIFECKTCGLVGSLCCCTECAQVCHSGHECKLKRTSPTAYCDCWEKCPCKSLVAGDQIQRDELLHKLVDETDLSTLPNKKGQHILLFLAQTVARQSVEQIQYVPNRMSSENSKSRITNSRGRVRSQSPPIDHELEPPKFARTSLLYLLKNWRALKSMIFFGQNQNATKRVNSLDENIITSSLLQADDMVKYLNAQNGASSLDNFVHKLIVKCNREFLDTLVQSLIDQLVLTKQSENNEDYQDAVAVSKRFIHSVIRVYVVLSACTSPTTVKRKGVVPSLLKCKNVFISLNFIAGPELAKVAGTIFAPVRMGVVYPSTPFTLGSSAESMSLSDDFFTMTPLPGRTTNTNSSSITRENPRVRFAENPSVDEVMDGMETENTSQNQPNEEEQADNSQTQGESDMELDLMAESESDSDDSNHGDGSISHSNTSGDLASGESSRRSGDGYFSTAEVSETEGEDEEGIEEEENEEEEDDEDEDDEDEETENQEENNEQRNNTGTRDNNTTPNSLQWAVRNTQSALQASSTSTAAAHVAGSGLVFIDPAHIRRSGSAASVDGSPANTMYCTPSALARTFGCLIRELSDIMSPLGDQLSHIRCNSKLSDRAAILEAKKSADNYLLSTWEWLWTVMETTEAQLKFGASVTAVSDPTHPQHPLYDSQNKNSKQNNTRGGTNSNLNNQFRTFGDNRRKKRAGGSQPISSDVTNGRQDYLAYLLSLMRSQDNEHADSIPKVEITSLRHVAFILDSFIYYLRATQNLENSSFTDEEEGGIDNKPIFYQHTPSTSKKRDELNEFRVLANDSSSASLLKSDMEDDDDDDDVTEEKELVPYHTTVDAKTLRQTFFKRSDSTCVLGQEPADPFSSTLKEALPLAERPHLLNPNSRRDQLFGALKNNEKNDCPEASLSMKLNVGSSSSSCKYLNMSPNIYLGRWSMCLELFGRVFLDDVGSESNSILNELGRYDVKETKFKRDMEKLRNGHQKDLFIEGLDRNRPILMQQSLRQLNAQFGRRVPGAGPLNIHRLKVSFKEEQGEGSGVVRSFYTALCNAFMADEKLPNLDNIFSGSKGLTHQLRVRAKERERERRRNSGNNITPGLIPRAVRRNERTSERVVAELENCVLSLDAPSYVLPMDTDESEDEHNTSNPIPHHKKEIGRRIYKKVNSLWPEYAPKITGMLLEFTPTQLVYLLTHDQVFKDKANEAAELIASSQDNQSSLGSQQDTPLSGNSKLLPDRSPKTDLMLESENDLDNSPLFFQPGKPGFYSPRAGKNSPQRINCFRNVGRIIGLCLLQNEICPLTLNRHVIKYLLGRRVSWHDLAFFDPTLYESFRQLINDLYQPDNNVCSMLDLTYSVQLRPEEGGGTVDLVSGGSQVEVAADNVLDFVKRYAEYRMVTNARKALQAMRRGLLDVIPSVNLDGLTAEDFRLLLNGSGDINVKQLMSYTSFSDETGGEGQEKLSKFKRWFWSMVENMTAKQKQDLLYFWTSSPAMPASAEGFQPLPSVTVKPANDHQLPTANTCISRLYVPLYSSKAILRSKFLLAIKTKVFGFV